SIEGPGASEILEALTSPPSPDLDALPHLHFRNLEIGGFPARLTAHRRELTPRFDVTASPDAAKTLLDTVVARGALLGGELVREARRIEASRPRFGVDMDESHLPQEASLDEAISFQKGCYIGQEYVVRLAHRGHVNRKLRGLRIAGMIPALPGAPVLRDDAEVGVVTSSAPSPAFGCALALAYLRREHGEPGSTVTAGKVVATVSGLPFDRPA
ncbi:MAG: glycine cleavage T C-terminal barrel domain-containing protein, partial [Vicinamibacteria bacterium]